MRRELHHTSELIQTSSSSDK